MASSNRSARLVAALVALVMAQGCAMGGSAAYRTAASPSVARDTPSDFDGAADESNLRENDALDGKKSVDREEIALESVVTTGASAKVRAGPNRGPAAPPPPAPQAPGGAKPAEPRNHEPAKPVPLPTGTGPASAENKPVDGPQRPNAPLLIYEARFRLAVFRTDATLAAVETMARDMGGYLVSRTSDVIIVRVPKDRFQEALGTVEKSGDVVARKVTTQDVTDEFLDLEIRLKNARAVRDRLQELLAKSNTIQDSLAIERELSRLSEQIEQFEGRLKGIRDRVAFSKIEVSVQPRATENLQKNAVRLPFPWMYGLGLSRLLELHE